MALVFSVQLNALLNQLTKLPHFGRWQKAEWQMCGCANVATELGPGLWIQLRLRLGLGLGLRIAFGDC